MAIEVIKEYDIRLFDSIQKENAILPLIDPNSKIIFLDIDGVLNSGPWIQKNSHLELDQLIDPDAVKILNQIIHATNAKIVISSTWRKHFSEDNNGLKRMQEFFAKYDISPIVGRTSSLSGKQRSSEIQAWLDKNLIASFVIIDDDRDADIQDRFIKILFTVGFQEYHIKEAIDILERKI